MQNIKDINLNFLSPVTKYINNKEKVNKKHINKNPV